MPTWSMAVLLAVAALLLEWMRAIALRHPWPQPLVLIAGGLALCLLGSMFRPEQLGLSWRRLAPRLLGGLALGAVLLLPAAVRWHGGPQLGPALSLVMLTVSVGEEVAFRGALFAALERAWGGGVAVLGSAAVFTAGHVLSHPPAFLLAVAAAGLVLGLWRWACRDLIAPIVGHSLADLAL